MATRILDLDLDTALPDSVPLDGRDQLRVIAWRTGVPVGSALLRPALGHGAIERAALAEATRALDADAPPEAEPHGPLPALSVVICSRDRPDRLPIALDALASQTLTDFELIIVDNAPRDGRARRVVEEHAPAARYVVEPVPGLPRARNAGIHAATGDVIAFTDDDCRPVPGWVASIARRFAQAPALGCVSGPILPLELETPAQEAMEARGGFNRGYRPVLHAPDAPAGPIYPVQAWAFGAGGSMALSRPCLEALGGFDEALSRSEDLDIFYRTIRAGFTLWFEPGAAVRHRHLPTWGQFARRLFHWGWGYTVYLDKIVRTDTEEFAARARRERRNWIRFQLRDRLVPALRNRADLPLPLVLLELAGGLAGLEGYPLARVAAARRAKRALSAARSRALLPASDPGRPA